MAPGMRAMIRAMGKHRRVASCYRPAGWKQRCADTALGGLALQERDAGLDVFICVQSRGVVTVPLEARRHVRFCQVLFAFDRRHDTNIYQQAGAQPARSPMAALMASEAVTAVNLVRRA